MYAEGILSLSLHSHQGGMPYSVYHRFMTFKGWLQQRPTNGKITIENYNI